MATLDLAVVVAFFVNTGGPEWQSKCHGILATVICIAYHDRSWLYLNSGF